ncbi:serine protease FAM111A-like [Saccopteryx bilineata]|uniref:serine protease FAM111A-like n=1 Tax=Saccopteryx bilineata TaxID=59482 RepID=UPI00338F21E5
MSSKKRKSQRVPFESKKNRKIEDYFHQINKEQENNSTIPQKKTGTRKGIKDITNNQAQGPKDQAVSQNKVLYITVDVNLKENQEMKHRLSHSGRDSLSEALDTLQAVRKEREARLGREMLVRGVEGIKGYVNLGMPLCCFPDNCHLAVTFARSKSKQKEENQIFGRHDKASTDCVKFFIRAIEKKRKRIVKCGELHKEGCMLCVYAFKGETVKDAICKDGRFLPVLEKHDWKLDEIEGIGTECTQRVDDLEGKSFHIILIVKESMDSRAAGTQNSELEERSTWKDIVAKCPSLKGETEKIRKSFKEQMKGKKGKTLFQLHKTDFGKLIKNSTLVKMHKLLSHLSDSVGYISWDNNGNRGSATCFVFRGLYIFTCHHVISDIVGEGIEPVAEWADIIAKCARVTFDYEDSPEKVENFFSIEPWFDIYDKSLDYAVLKLKENGQQVPLGLYNRVGPVPLNGLIYIIGHPDGESKSTDTCAVIPLGQRLEKVQEHLQARKAEGYNHFVPMFSQKSFQENIPRPDVTTYNTSFYFGSSGSPVFDSKGSLVAMHAAGFTYQYQEGLSSLIEFGCTMDSICHDLQQNHGPWCEELGIPSPDIEMMSDDN